MKTNMLRIAKIAGLIGVFLLTLNFLDISFAQQQTDYGIRSTGLGMDISGNDLVSWIKNAINFVLSILGLVAVIMIIYAGIRLTSSAGNEDAQAAAKKIITYALIGLLIVALSWVIVEFVTRAIMSGESGQLAS